MSPHNSIHTIPSVLQEAVLQRGNRLAVVEEGGREWTYCDLSKQVNRVARSLLAIGINHGDRVAIWAPNCANWIVAALGLQTIGAALVPLNTRLKGREAAYILRKSGAKLLFTFADFLGNRYPEELYNQDTPDLRTIVLMHGDSGGETWSSFLDAGNDTSQQNLERVTSSVTGDDISDILFTSGTTGFPKGAVTTHRQNTRLYRSYVQQLGLYDRDRYLIVNPFFHAFGYKAGWLAALMSGATIHPQAVLDTSRVLGRISSERISVLPGPPTLFQSLLLHPDLSSFDLSSLRLAITGAATVPEALIGEMRKKLRFKTVLTAYGLTETCGTVTMCTPDDDVRAVAATSGRPMTDIELKVVNGDGHDVTSGEAGEVLVRGYNVMREYWDEPSETRSAIDALGWLHTGDIGVLNERGYLSITDRKKDMFIVGGFNCYPAEIESVLISHPLVERAAVIGVADARLGEVGKAFIVLRKDALLTSESVITWCRKNMANYKVPRFVEFREHLPMNASGKVQKFVLRNAGGSP